jgi:hypothetical protein
VVGSTTVYQDERLLDTSSDSSAISHPEQDINEWEEIAHQNSPPKSTDSLHSGNSETEYLKIPDLDLSANTLTPGIYRIVNVDVRRR